jgi:hypothetical protein
LGAFVIALPIQGGGVVNDKENLQQLMELNFRRIVVNLHHFSVPSLTRANLLISGIQGLAIAVPRYNIQNTFDPVKHSLNTPKAAPS